MILKDSNLALNEYMKDGPSLSDFITKDGDGSVISFDEKGFSMTVLDHLKDGPQVGVLFQH